MQLRTETRSSNPRETIQEAAATTLLGGHMAHDLGLHHSWRQAPPNEAGVLRRANDERKCLFDLKEHTGLNARVTGSWTDCYENA